MKMMKNNSGHPVRYNESVIAMGEVWGIADCDIESMKSLGFVSMDSEVKKVEVKASPEEGK